MRRPNPNPNPNQARQLAKLGRDFVKADALRAELMAKGIRIDDRTRCEP